MKILVTNDDGVYAAGLVELAHSFLQAGHEVIVVAPDREKSASAHAMTMDLPLTVKEVQTSDYSGIRAYAVTGTPTDCVKIGLTHIEKIGVDLVVSGINHGANLGTDIVYSGTVNAALEAGMMGYPAVAFSQCIEQRKRTAGFGDVLARSAQLALRLTESMKLWTVRGTIYNINFPAGNAAKGIRVCPQGICDYDQAFEKRVDPFGREYYWISGNLRHNPYNEEYETDVKWIGEGYITLTPLRWRQTAEYEFSDAKCRIQSAKLHFE